VVDSTEFSNYRWTIILAAYARWMHAWPSYCIQYNQTSQIRPSMALGPIAIGVAIVMMELHCLVQYNLSPTIGLLWPIWPRWFAVHDDW